MTAPAPVVRLVGAGPGDPGLLAVRAQGALAEAQVVAYDAEVAAGCLALVPDAAERIRVADGGPGLSRAEVPAALASRARAGLRAVRLVAGDAGSFGAEMEALAAAGLAVEVIPGVTPAVAAAVYAGIPVHHPGVSPRAAILEAVEPAAVAGLDWGAAARLADTLLVRVGAGTLGAVVESLIRGGRHPETPAALVVAATTSEQRTLTASLRDLPAEARRDGVGASDGTPGPPALVLVVGDVVRLRPRLAWLEGRPLHRRRVVVTRPRPQVERFATLLESYGAEVIALPTIRLEPPEDWRPLDAAIAELGRFGWVVFTSANGVAAFRERLQAAGRDARALAGAGVAAIGPETADALQRAGLRPDVVPPEYRAERLVEALRPRLAAGAEVLLVRAAEAREVLPRELGALGARVTVAPAYRTVPAKEGADRVLGLLEARRLDVVTFTSSSTVRGFMGLFPPEEIRRLLGGVVLAAIGPITAATIAEYGLEVAVMPRDYTIPALAEAIATHFTRPA